jgi:chemotaxis methyl-accepting protein methylase
MTTGAWSDLLLDRCGLALKESQMSALSEFLHARPATLGLRDAAAYLDVLRREDETGAEWSEVIDCLVSHQTSFFRHPESFDAIRTRLLPELRGRTAVGTNQLSICSAGCSTGEEAYSLAMTLIDQEGPGNFSIFGADLSRRVLDVARRGSVSTRALEAIPQRYRRYVGVLEDGSFEIVEEVRRHVRFLPANLLASCGMFMSYDLIVCQNVLIYFAPAAIPRVLSALASSLTPGGFLLLGPGEAPAECPARLEPVGINGVRAFRRVGCAVREVRS